MANTTGDGGGSTTTSDSDSDSDSAFTSVKATSWWATLKAIGKNPFGAILGIVLTQLLIGLETVVLALQDAVLFVFTGSTRGSLAGMWGIADLPSAVGMTLTTAGSATGDALLTAIDSVNQPVLAAIEVLGPFAPIVAAVYLVAEVVVVLIVLRKLVLIILDAIPGGGGLV